MNSKMDNKLVFFAVAVFGICQLAIGLPMFSSPIYISPETLQNLDTLLREENALNPIVLTKREAPVYEPKASKSEVKKDLQSSATGYGGHGGYGSHGGYGNAPTGYVGYGAKTGGYGAFSWYTNHPVGGGGYGHGGY